MKAGRCQNFCNFGHRNTYFSRNKTIRMKLRSTLMMLAAACALSCNAPQKEYQLKVKLQKLTAANIYDQDLVYDVIFDAQELNMDSLQDNSRKMFLQAIDMYKNKHNPAEGAKLLKNSILTFPAAKAYYELGNALVDNSKTGYMTIEEALNAYSVAEHLDFQPVSSVYYKEAIAHYMLYNAYSDENDKSSALYSAVSALRYAFSNGFTDSLALKKDPKISGIINTMEYKQMMLDMQVIQAKHAGTGNGLFALYKKSFPVPQSQFKIDVWGVDMKDYTQSISYEFAPFIPEMENTSFGREVSHDYFYVTRVAETPKYTAVIYSSISFYGENMQPVYTTLATYDNEGNIKSRKLISCQCSAEKIKTAALNGSEIVIEDYKRIWDKPIDKVPFENNRVKDFELLSEAKFRIDDNGMIVNENVPKNYNDSTFVAPAP
jgi:hypothetical protein